MKSLKELKEGKFQELLNKNIDSNEIKYRVQSSGFKNDGTPFVMLVKYIDARVAINRLNDIFGVFGWSDSYSLDSASKSVVCILSVLCVNEKGDTITVTKSDIGTCTDIESLKGGYSDALKRTCVKLGIGTDLYEGGNIFAKLVTKKGPNTISVCVKDKSKFRKEKFKDKWVNYEIPTIKEVKAEVNAEVNAEPEVEEVEEVEDNDIIITVQLPKIESADELFHKNSALQYEFRMKYDEDSTLYYSKCKYEDEANALETQLISRGFKVKRA